MYATSANSAADDGSGQNGLFTGHLLNNLKTEGLSVFAIFNKTMGDVVKTTGAKQYPELSLRFPDADSVYLGSRSVPDAYPASARASVPNAADMKQTDPLIGEMALVRGGTFTMGCTPEQGNDCNDDERPARRLTLSDFYIGKYEVTQAQWREIMWTDVRQQRDKTDISWPITGEGDNYPMYHVSWTEVQEFIVRLNEKTGKNYRLPTEAEWEYAARGGGQSKGYKYSGSSDIEEIAWYYENS